MLAADGGCERPCGYRMSCGHSCHVASLCHEPCQRPIPACGHPCQRQCHQKCGGCTQQVDVTLACGHIIKATCEQALLFRQGRESIKCTQNVLVNMPLCSHNNIELPCWKSLQLKKEQAQLLGKAPQLNALSETLALFSYPEKCGCLLPGCHHPCQRACGKCTLATVKNQMKWKGERSQHAGPCTTFCTRLLFCGHTCSAKSSHSGDESSLQPKILL